MKWWCVVTSLNDSGPGTLRQACEAAGPRTVVFRVGGTPPADADHDGMPDAWEQERGLDPADPEDRNLDPTGTGYTNLEIYLNFLIPFPAQWPRRDSNRMRR